MDEDVLSHIQSTGAERQGWLVMTPDGIIKDSFGDLKDRSDVAKSMLGMLRDAGDILGENKAEFRRLCVCYEKFQYAVQLFPNGEEIAVVKDTR